MAIYDSEIEFGGLKLEITRMSPIRRQKTVKQIIGRSVAQVRIIGLDRQQWELDVTGVITAQDANQLFTKRLQLEGLNNSRGHELIDGYHNGTYYIEPGSLEFDDTSDRVHSSYTYTMRLIEV